MSKQPRNKGTKKKVGTFELNHSDLMWSAEVKVDFNVSALHVKTAVEFWVDWESHLAHHSGDYLMAFLQRLARKLLVAQITHGFKTAGMNDWLKAQEGWFPLNGSHGITLTRLDTMDFELGDFSVVTFK